MRQNLLRALIPATLFLAFHPLVHASTCEAKLKRIAEAGVPINLFNQMARSVNDHTAGVKDHIALVDYTKPSSEKRMFIINLNDGKVMRYRVSHGIGNAKRGDADTAKEFTLPEEVERGKKLPDENGSRKVSLGLYQIFPSVDILHRGGKALKVRGLDKVNKLAEQRMVLIQQGGFMSDTFVNKHKYAGRSWGSFSVDPASLGQIITLIRGSVLYAGLSAKVPEHGESGSELRKLLRCPGDKRSGVNGAVAKGTSDQVLGLNSPST
jgi:hypothetical protein